MTFLNNHRTLRNLLIVGVIAAIALLLRSQLRALSDHLVQHPTEVRPVGWIALLISVVILLFVARMALPMIYRFRHQTTLRFTRRQLQWWLPAISLIALLVLFLISATYPTRGPFAGLTAAGVLPLLIPLLAGVQAGTLISLEDERTLELPLSYARPFAWQVAEHAIFALCIHLLLGLLGTLIVNRISGAEIGDLLLTWLPPTILLWGLGVRVSIATRQIVFSVLSVLLLWYVLLYYGQAIMLQYPYLWLVHPFLTQQSLPFLLLEPSTGGDFLLNRLLITVGGLLLFASALYQLSDVEWVLTGRYPILMHARREVTK